MKPRICQISSRWYAAYTLAGRALCVALLMLSPAVLAQDGGSNDRWVGTWASVPVARCPGQSAGQAPPVDTRQCEPTDVEVAPGEPVPFSRAPLPVLHDQTVRQIVRVSVGGERVRVVLTNAYGTVPLTIGAAHVALHGEDAAIVEASARALTFAGRPGMIIPPGALIVSDPVALVVPASADLAIDVYLPGDTAATTSPITVHAGTGGLQTNYISTIGDHTGVEVMPVTATTQAWVFLARVEVSGPDDAGAIVALGDSITDGSQSTPDTNSRWPDQLARRLVADNVRMGVLNAGFSGNRVLSDGSNVNALARFDRDVLAPAGVTHVIVLDGINDIGSAGEDPSPTAADIIAGHRQLIERAHSHGLKIYGATLTPFEGARYWTEQGEAKRQAVNEWIRTSGAYDAVLDFDAVLRDPNDLTRTLPEYDPGDHLHANDAGYMAMADSIDLGLFKR
jgi:lysophospholipase L1-like esterase